MNKTKVRALTKNQAVILMAVTHNSFLPWDKFRAIVKSKHHIELPENDQTCTLEQIDAVHAAYQQDWIALCRDLAPHTYVAPQD